MRSPGIFEIIILPNGQIAASEATRPLIPTAIAHIIANTGMPTFGIYPLGTQLQHGQLRRSFCVPTIKISQVKIPQMTIGPDVVETKMPYKSLTSSQEFDPCPFTF